MPNNQLSREDILLFLQNAYFGSVDDPLYTAVHVAYLDMNRTIEFKTARGVTDEIKVQLRIEATNRIVSGIKSIIKETGNNTDYFDSKHEELCQGIIKIYKDKNVPFHYGQAQKWINMAMKYYCVLNLTDANKFINLMHLPVDSIVFEKAKDLLSVPYPSYRWSRMDGKQYKGYLSQLRNALSQSRDPIPPMVWEFWNWER